MMENSGTFKRALAASGGTNPLSGKRSIAIMKCFPLVDSGRSIEILRSLNSRMPSAAYRTESSSVKKFLLIRSGAFPGTTEARI